MTKTQQHVPQYPIMIPSKGRYKEALTANTLRADGIPFHLVVEESERDEYAKRFGDDSVLVLPFSNQGSVIPARNWCKDWSTEQGFERHWQLDDNMSDFLRWNKGKRIPCNAGVALRVCEDFTDRYENIAISGLNYSTWARQRMPPFFLNTHVYSCSLILNSIPHKWRGIYNEDTDLCLQVLADGWCTVLINAFLAEKRHTMTMGGGNTTDLYQGDGRAKMSRHLERLWPGVVTTRRRFQRPQHVVYDSWQRFDTQLKRKQDVEISNKPNEYGMRLRAVAEIKSKGIRDFLESNQCSGTT